MRWGEVNALNLLWLLIPLGAILLHLLKRRERALARLFDPRVHPTLIPGRAPGRVRARVFLWFLALALGMVALARPQWGYTLEEVKRRSMDIMIVLDTSNSMLAEDIKPNRLRQAQFAVKDLVKRLKGDRIGLVVFAGDGFLQCPLTIDYAAFMLNLDDVYAGIIPRGGTSINLALRHAIEGFGDPTGADRAIILITDGEDHEGQAEMTIKALNEENIRVFAIGVGTREGELIPSPDPDEPGFLKNQEGAVVKSTLREGLLEELALRTGGIYVRSTPGDFGLSRIVDEGLSHLKRDETASRMMKSYEERFHWALVPAFLLLGLEAALREKRRRAPEEESGD